MKKFLESVRSSCRVCGSTKLIPILSLGEQYVSNFVDEDYDYKEEERVPLELILCDPDYDGCGLLQLKHTASRTLLYKQQYWFRSGLNETMKMALRDITQKAENLIKLSPHDIVLDIGCNDGTLLRSYRSKAKLVGFEPANNLISEAKIGTDHIINDFFSFNNFKKYFNGLKCKIITSIAMFYDLEEPNSFVKDVAKCLDHEGIWIIQMAYLDPMLKLNAFDNIGHEHLEYYSFKSLKKLLEKYSLDVFDVEMNEVYGGSFRVYVKHKDNYSVSISTSVSNLEAAEKKFGLDDKKTYEDFANRVISIKEKLFSFIKTETANGKIVYAYGASTKGNTFLQYCDLDNTLIKKAVDRDPIKHGKKTIGTNIPIISEEQARLEKPDYFLILPWHLLEYFKQREKQFLDNGGKFIVPLPEFKIVGR
jgi:2-polyprenyl-3-methyl-5-hydroxy-6-metoxy-1,4-benzoquinol methylase